MSNEVTSQHGRYIAVEGPTGAGKTTLANRLATALNATLMLDPFEANPFLPQLLAQPASSPELALRVELTFFALRVAQLRHIRDVLAQGGWVVADWALPKQTIFAATTLDTTDTGRLAATVDLWADSRPAADLLIGLSAPTRLLRERVRHRGRQMEAAITTGQLAGLSAAFEHAYTTWPGPLIRLDTATFDVFNDHHLNELTDHVRQLPTLLETR